MSSIDDLRSTLERHADGLADHDLHVRPVAVRERVRAVRRRRRSALAVAAVAVVGVATLATFVGAGGLGDIIINGIKLGRTPVLVTGSVLCACVALALDWAGAVAERALSPRGVS